MVGVHTIGGEGSLLDQILPVTYWCLVIVALFQCQTDCTGCDYDYVHVYVRTYVCMYLCTYVRTDVCTYVCMYVSVYIRCMYSRMYVCTVCIYVCVMLQPLCDYYTSDWHTYTNIQSLVSTVLCMSLLLL